ncbi:MAG: DUF3619 family protein [Pseudomonadota bacterium]
MGKLAKLERELAQERAMLVTQLRSVGSDLAPRQIVNAASRAALASGNVSLGAAGEVARRNKGPLALAATAIGWLALNAIRPEAGQPSSGGATRATAQGQSGLASTDASFDARVARAQAATPGRFGTETFEGGNSMSTYHPDTSSTPTSPTLKDRAYATAEDLRTRIEEGLDGLPDDAKARVRAAREAALAAQQQVQQQAAATAQHARQSAHDNPLLVGALAFAAGAAIAAYLPRTSVEDRTIGAHRDRLFDEADRVLREETAKLKGLAEDTIAAGQAKAKEVVSDAADSAQASVAALNPKASKPKSAANGRA